MRNSLLEHVCLHLLGFMGLLSLFSLLLLLADYYTNRLKVRDDRGFQDRAVDEYGTTGLLPSRVSDTDKIV